MSGKLFFTENTYFPSSLVIVMSLCNAESYFNSLMIMRGARQALRVTERKWMGEPWSHNDVTLLNHVPYLPYLRTSCSMR